MPLSSSELNALKQSVVQGEVEPVLVALLEKLEKTSSEWSELAQAIRVIQADYLQTKSQVIRGTISGENARLAYNQINANLLDIIERIESGKKTLADPAPPPKQAWRYYVAGGVVTLALALAGWAFFSKPQQDKCPVYGDQVTERIMLLPFKKTGTGNNSTPEIDISDGLNDLIVKDPLLRTRAESDVYESYNIEENYPNPSEATLIANNCGVEMIVWGKVRNGKDTVEVRYKLLNPSVKTAQNSDERVNKLLELVDEGVWVDNVKTISKMLYMVVANQKGDKQMAMALFNDLYQSSAMKVSQTDTIALNQDDVTKMLIQADLLRTNGQTAAATTIYDQILVVYPQNQQALQRRGAINYEGGKFWAAARDLQEVEPDPTKVSSEILALRVDAYLKCGWPDKARQDLEQYKKRNAPNQDKVFVKSREQAISDSLKIYQQRLEISKKITEKQPNDVNAQLKLAQTHTALGQPDKAIAIAENVQKRKPRNVEAFKTVVEAAAQKGDHTKVNETVEKVEKAGMSTKGFKFLNPTVAPLMTEKKGN